MAFKNQSETEIQQKRSRKYVFEHVRTREIEGFEKLELAKSIVLSPSWKPESDEAKKLFKKMQPKKEQ